MLPNGDMILAGGCSSDMIIKYRHLMIAYPKLKKCSLISLLPEPLKTHSTKYINGCIYLFGGKKTNEKVGNRNVMCFNLKTRIWSQKSDLNFSYELNHKDFSEIFLSVKKD